MRAAGCDSEWFIIEKNTSAFCRENKPGMRKEQNKWPECDEGMRELCLVQLHVTHFKSRSSSSEHYPPKNKVWINNILYTFFTAKLNWEFVFRLISVKYQL